MSRIDPVTREGKYTQINRSEGGFHNAAGFDVYKGQPCMTQRVKDNHGLWCMNDDGSMELKIPQEKVIGVLFAPSTDN